MPDIFPERQWSEQYRLAGEAWVKADAQARALEEGKSVLLAEAVNLMVEDGMSVAAAERKAKATDQYKKYLRAMVDARTAANMAKVRAQAADIQFKEWMSADANKRQEMKLAYYGGT